ncbi:hypothetical protein [Spirosoma fluviale]|uniref:DoxX protein n=1 Tax=Spirosoma fluviale TaxID=1597977 RepID=A0A286FE11_9BACT|nr:hypothetical protein [Spirosoma fluviale]SOD81475.1 hypothetical protein SAMN06269250_1805 [Spirosoma fluviale]
MNLLKLKQLAVIQLFTIYLRYLLGGAFVFASIVKIQGQRFTTDSGANAPIHDAWHFFETLYQSGLYWQFLGWGQLIAGFLLMTQVFSTLGAMMFFPIIVNIFVITISYYFAGTPVITFLMLLANVYLLVWDWNRLKVVVLPTLSGYVDEVYPLMRKPGWAYLGLFYAGLSILAKLAIQSFTSLLLMLGVALIVGLAVLIYTLKGHKKAILFVEH